MKSNTTKYLLAVAFCGAFGSIVISGAILGWGAPRCCEFADESLFLGIPRRDWIDIHLFFAASCVVLSILHIWLNSTWLVDATKHHFKTHWIGAMTLLTWSWVLFLFFAWSLAFLATCFHVPSLGLSSFRFFLGL